MYTDMTVPCDEGFLNIRVGAIIIKDGKVLMVGNERSDYCYSVGGRIRFGETAEQAVIREVLEETGVTMEIDRLGFVHENYFFSDASARRGRLVYEIAFFFYMKVPEDFTPVSYGYTEDNVKEQLRWLPLDTPQKFYPDFFRTELAQPSPFVKHFVTDERPASQ